MSQQGRQGYVTPGRFNLNPIDPGRIVLVAGEAMSGVRDVVFGLTVAGIDHGEGAIAITTDRSGRGIRSSIEGQVGTVPPDRFSIIDASGSGREDGEVVRTLSGPGDLTGIGIEFSSVYGELIGADVDRVRTGLHSVSTLLMYNDLRTVFRFLHTVTGRIESVDGLGVLGIDPSAHDDRSVSTVAQLCDGRIDIRETDAGERQLRVSGLDDQPREWTPVG